MVMIIGPHKNKAMVKAEQIAAKATTKTPEGAETPPADTEHADNAE